MILQGGQLGAGVMTPLSIGVLPQWASPSNACLRPLLPQGPLFPPTAFL